MRIVFLGQREVVLALFELNLPTVSQRFLTSE